MKVKCTSYVLDILIIATSEPKSEKSSKKMSKIAKASKAETALIPVEKRKEKSVPAKGLEVEENESDVDLVNEIEEENAHNKLVEKSQQPDTSDDEDVPPLSLTTLISGGASRRFSIRIRL